MAAEGNWSNVFRISGATGEFLRRLGTAALGLLYPPHCASCGAGTEPGIHLCGDCAAKVRRIKPPFCRGCSEPFAGTIAGDFLCADCHERDFQFTCAISPYRAAGVVREFILRFKYQQHYYLRHQLAEWLAAGLDDERLRDPAPEFPVPVPVHAARERQREFNQARVAADLLSPRCGWPELGALERSRYTTMRAWVEMKK